MARFSVSRATRSPLIDAAATETGRRRRGKRRRRRREISEADKSSCCEDMQKMTQDEANEAGRSRINLMMGQSEERRQKVSSFHSNLDQDLDPTVSSRVLGCVKVCSDSDKKVISRWCCKVDRQTEKRRKGRRRISMMHSQVVVVVVTVMLMGPIYLLACLSLLNVSEAAVVRPTIFSGLNSAEMSASGSSSSTSQAPALVQQQQQQQPHPPLQSGGISNQAAIMLFAQQHDQGSAHQNTKINPLKSRFCAHSARPLGLQSMELDEFSLSASSHSNEQVRPHLARLNLELAGGAWCPGKPISSSTFGKEWIQVKLNRSQVISAIETQGRFGMGAGKEFVPAYTIEYSRNSGKTWHKWKDFRGSSLLRANEDVNSPVRNELSPPIVGANLLRILPYSQHLRTVCLRFELHGCPYDEGAPIAYATSEGVVEPRWGHLIDYTYDGLRLAGRLSAGLGQLVDGVLGPDNFGHNSGFEWVGWKSMNGDLEIEFTFASLRNFSQALFHSNNLFSSGVEVFQAIDVHFGIEHSLAIEPLRDALREERRRREVAATPPLAPSESSSSSESSTRTGEHSDFLLPSPAEGGGPLAGTLWSRDVLSIEYEPDKSSESARPVTVHLKQRLANKLKFILKFASKWILLSEVEFISSRVELLAQTSLLPGAPEREQTLALVNALNGQASSHQPSTYDQCLAIVREHQLRKAAASAFMESLTSKDMSAGGSASAIDTVTLTNHLPPSRQSADNNNQPDNNNNNSMIQTISTTNDNSSENNYDPPAADYSTPPSQFPPAMQQDRQLMGGGSSFPQDEPSAPSDSFTRELYPPRPPGKHVPGPPIPIPNTFWHLATGGGAPSTNPILSQFAPPLLSGGPSSSSGGGGGILGRSPSMLGDISGAADTFAPPGSVSFGPTSAILLALVALLTLIGLLLLISSGHLHRFPRRRPKLGVPSSLTTGRSVISSASSHHSSTSKGGSGLHAFLNQVLHPSSAGNGLHSGDHTTRYTRNSPPSLASSHHTPLPGTLSSTGPNLFGQQEPHQQHLYNVIYAKNDRHQHTPFSGMLGAGSATLHGQQQQQQHLYNVIYGKNDRHHHTPISGVLGSAGSSTLPGQQEPQQHLYNVIYAKNDRHQHTHKPVLPLLPGQQQQQQQLFNLL